MLKYPCKTSKIGVDKTPDYEMSFETLFEVLMREKNREDLQRLEADFFSEAKRYIQREKSTLELQDDFHGAMSRVKQLEDMLLEIYSRRERKILSLASIKAKTNADVFDVSAMLDFEKDTFRKIVDILTYNRRLIRSQVKGIKIRTETSEKADTLKPEESLRNNSDAETEDNKNDEAEAGIPRELERSAFSKDEAVAEDESEPESLAHSEIPESEDENNGAEALNNDDSRSNSSSHDKVPVKFLKPIGKFVGEELETYGPFDEGDMAKIPKSIAKVLVDREEAELQ